MLAWGAKLDYVENFIVVKLMLLVPSLGAIVLTRMDIPDIKHVVSKYREQFIVNTVAKTADDQ